MKRILPVDGLARDERFDRIRIEDVVFDPLNASAREQRGRQGGFRIDNEEAPDAARGLMHGICVGESQALEGAGRTCRGFGTDDDPERRQQALDFQRAVDKLFSVGGFRGEEEENPVHLARKFRSLAGFSEEEITELVDTAAEAYAEAQAMQTAAVAGA